VNTQVTITGTNLAGATQLTFNGAAAIIESDSATQILTSVPNNATTGNIAVTTPGGVATIPFTLAITVGQVPFGVSSDGTHVWVANESDNSVSELNASTGSVIQTIPVGSPPFGVSSDGTHVWVAGFGVVELNASTGSVIQTITVGEGPSMVSSDGTHVWVTNFGSNTVSEISIVGFTITTSSLPNATPGAAYGPVTLQAANLGTSTSPYTTTLKWTGAELPKGLRLSSAGVLSGTPNKKLIPGTYSVVAQVTETVTTLNGKKKVKTKTTVQATIPLTIT
jgi:YVTN family beta-propeller protein